MRTRPSILALMVLAVVAASCRVTDVSISTGTIRVGPTGVSWDDGRAASRAVLKIPEGALVDVDSAGLNLIVSGYQDNSNGVEIEVSGFANDTVNAPSGDNVFEARAQVPENCSDGCEVEVVLIATHKGEGEPPSFFWRVDFIFIYDAESIPVPEAEFDVEFVPVDPPPVP